MPIKSSPYFPTCSVISHAVLVVPMLAPKINPTPWVSVISPALTKLDIITVETELDCTRKVTITPTRHARIRFAVI